MNKKTDTTKTKNAVKSRLMTLYKMFYEHTDEDHQVTYDFILEYLEDHGVPANNKTVRDDIQLLMDMGYDIVRVISRPNRYFMGNREFEVAEVKLLIDAVSSSRFITDKKSKELAKKLTNLTSEYQRKGLRRNIFAVKREKTDNEEIMYIIDTVNDAINSRKKIAFKYTEYSVYGEKVFRNDGEVYELSPYALFWNDDNYYVVGWSEKHDNVSVFRTDRLYKPEILKEKAAKKPKGFKLEDYSKRIFEMYDGESTEVRLKCRSEFMKYIVDRFGDDLPVIVANDDQFVVTVEVSLSPTFYAWVFRFNGGIRILSPKKAIDEYVQMARTAISEGVL